MENRIFTQKEAVAAYKAMERIGNQSMSWKTTYWFVKLKKKLKAQNDFQNDCEKKIIEKYQPEVLPDGRMKLKSAEEAKAFDKEWNEVGAIELTDLKFQKVIIPAFENLSIGPDDMEALEGFVEFEGGEEEEPDISIEPLQLEPVPVENTEETEDTDA